MKQGERVLVNQSVSTDRHRAYFAGVIGLIKKRVAASPKRGGSAYYIELDSGEVIKFFHDELTPVSEIHCKKLVQLRKSLTDHDLAAMKTWCGWVMDDRIHSVSENTASIVLNLIEAFEITVKENSL